MRRPPSFVQRIQVQFTIDCADRAFRSTLGIHASDADLIGPDFPSCIVSTLREVTFRSRNSDHYVARLTVEPLTLTAAR